MDHMSTVEKYNDWATRLSYCSHICFEYQMIWFQEE